jgi:hypothetical protein
MTSPDDYCEVCGARVGECSCVVSRDREAKVSGGHGRPPSSPPPDSRDELAELVGRLVVVAGRRARMRRDDDGSFVVTFEGDDSPPFRARGTPGEVLALAATYVQRR